MDHVENRSIVQVVQAIVANELSVTFITCRLNVLYERNFTLTLNKRIFSLKWP